MEKIQAAIAKARATRSEADRRPDTSGPASDRETEADTAPAPDPRHRPEPSAQQMPAPGSPSPQAPAIATAEPDRGAEISRAWEALTPYEPRARALARNRIVALSRGPGASEVDGMRTRLLQQIDRNGWRRIALTSPQPGCGKTTVAANLAFSLSRHADHRTMLFDLDFRNPALARVLAMRERRDIGRVLEGGARFEDNAVRYGDRLAIAPASSGIRAPAELLQSARAGEILDAIEQRYQPSVMLFDLPPLLASDDALAFMKRVDAVLLVAAAELTTIKQIDACERDLAAQTSVMGVVLNKCRYMEERDYGY